MLSEIAEKEVQIMYCKSCGEAIIGNKQVCPNCGEAVRSSLDISEQNLENTEDYSHEKTEKTNGWLDSLPGLILFFVVIGLVYLIRNYQPFISPRHVYKVGCDYLKEQVFSPDMDYTIKKYGKELVDGGGSKIREDLGEGEMHYFQFLVQIPVAVHSDEFKDFERNYLVLVSIHPFGYDLIFKESRDVSLAGTIQYNPLVGTTQNNTFSSPPENNGISESGSELEENDDAVIEDDPFYEEKGTEIVSHSELAGCYSSLDYESSFEINIYSSQEGDVIGNWKYNYSQYSGELVYRDGKYILCGDLYLSMEIRKDGNGRIEISLLDETNGEIWDEMSMDMHYES